jgi:hypothetical protein
VEQADGVADLMRNIRSRERFRIEEPDVLPPGLLHTHERRPGASGLEREIQVVLVPGSVGPEE